MAKHSSQSHYILGFSFLILSCIDLSAQQPSPVLGLQVPPQLATARSVYLAPAGFSAVGPPDAEVNSHILHAFLNAITQAGHYTFKSSPGEADLSMRMSIVSASTAVYSGSNFVSFFFHLEIYDTHTGMLLWTLEPLLTSANLRSTLLKNIDAGGAQLATDLQALANGQLPESSIDITKQLKDKH